MARTAGESGDTSRGEDPQHWVVYASLLAGAGPLALFHVTDEAGTVFQDPLSVTGLLLALFALVLPAIRPGWWKRSACGMLAGSVVVTAVYLFTTGPGTLWPIALAFAAIGASIPIAVGTWVGVEVGRFRQRGGREG